MREKRYSKDMKGTQEEKKEKEKEKQKRGKNWRKRKEETIQWLLALKENLLFNKTKKQ